MFAEREATSSESDCCLNTERIQTTEEEEVRILHTRQEQLCGKSAQGFLSVCVQTCKCQHGLPQTRVCVCVCINSSTTNVCTAER